VSPHLDLRCPLVLDVSSVMNMETVHCTEAVLLALPMRCSLAFDAKIELDILGVGTHLQPPLIELVEMKSEQEITQLVAGGAVPKQRGCCQCGGCLESETSTGDGRQAPRNHCQTSRADIAPAFFESPHRVLETTPTLCHFHATDKRAAGSVRPVVRFVHPNPPFGSHISPNAISQ